VLIVAIWREHQDHRAVERWFRGMKMADLLRLANAGFLQIAAATHFRFAPNHNSAKRLFRSSCARIVVDLFRTIFHPKKIAAASSRQFTDLHFAELAARHEMKLATLDTGISHRAIEIVVS
jgi:predicted nucleic acid-binding protein